MPVLTSSPWALLVLGGALAGPAMAQLAPGTDTDTRPHPVPGQVLSDAEMLPAESRDSTGAVLLHQSPVRAQQQQRNAYSDSAARTGVNTTIGRNVQRIVDRARGWDEPAEADVAPPLRDAPPGPATD
ncbi:MULTISPECIES: hypothetical protein [Ramlibacter]|uniref:DUF4148 domain-containing protein n=1 Tax=Ramlibacter pinisoli TaxID=2682844 RepID=A0A6N8IMK5_9BURK|nr:MULTISPECIES: hypothetical protein [Ramlibacter]MBA2960581.1 hypothetical protein [Ramlibacter sp. CGMCC 1.13660]MVQ27912.1 hypothetical protein [Ramlibacter pinisoli]